MMRQRLGKGLFQMLFGGSGQQWPGSHGHYLSLFPEISGQRLNLTARPERAGPAYVQPSPFCSCRPSSPPGGQFPWPNGRSCLVGTFPKTRGSNRSKPRAPPRGRLPNLSEPFCQNTSHVAPQVTQQKQVGLLCDHPLIHWALLFPLPPTRAGAPQ